MCSSLTLPCAPTMCAASPAISSGRCRHPASVSCPCDVGTYGRPAAGGGKFLNILKNVIFFFLHFTYALSCALPAFCLFFL
ncbi:unnamed protein product, partial [Staurois parvus]